MTCLESRACGRQSSLEQTNTLHVQEKDVPCQDGYVSGRQGKWMSEFPSGVCIKENAVTQSILTLSIDQRW